MKLPKGLFIGGTHLDRIGRSREPFLAGQSNPGSFKEYPGGAALNAASNFALLGGETCLICILGDDASGTGVKRSLAKRPLETIVAKRPEPTATYTSMVSDNGDLVGAIADMAIYDAVTPSILEGLGLQKLTKQHDFIFLDANLPTSSLVWLFESCRETPIYASPVSVAKASKLNGKIADIDFLICNRVEAQILADEIQQESSSSPGDILRAAGIASGVITNSDGPLICWDGGDVLEHRPAPNGRIEDVIGAGDAFGTAMFAARLAGLSLRERIQIAEQAAALVLETEGPYCERLSQLSLF
ncbi:MAG: PfkB family carbohydrate kinase [Pseudomonadota bacterium]